ncbi:uncharacterized protein [Aegilops tauschii subsp. strangulata]|uniref:uncharacterized protein n=1 Tax=Aegilops tauschii subsp. strangulata TaxID=200361 RepID=UPI003CC87E3F
MCVDFTNLNKACPQDPFPLPCIDQIVNSTIECDLLCLLDAFLGYHQIKMAVQDVGKMAFLTPCRDLEETFANLHKVYLWLNPEKCVFGVPSGKLLSFLVSHRGIEANPEKVKAIEEMSRPQTLKQMQKLVGCVTSLGRFISMLGERALPFFKLMKKKGPFEWTLEVNAAFQDLKRYLTSPPLMVAPRPLEPLLLYLAASPHSASAALVAVREERQAKSLLHDATHSVLMAQHQDGAPEAIATSADGGPAPEVSQPREVPQSQQASDTTNSPALFEHPVYFVSTVLRDARVRYPRPENLLLALFVASQYEGLIAGLKAVVALGVKHLTIRGDSQLLIKLSNKVYEPKDEHMEAYLAVVRKMEKQFFRLELQHVLRGTNNEAGDIAKWASRGLPQEPGVFEERLFKPSAAPRAAEPALPQEELPPPPT